MNKFLATLIASLFAVGAFAADAPAADAAAAKPMKKMRHGHKTAAAAAKAEEART